MKNGHPHPTAARPKAPPKRRRPERQVIKLTSVGIVVELEWEPVRQRARAK